MPLKYDDEPGSWWRQSDGWPDNTFVSEEDANLAYAYCVCHIPYGQFVRRERKIRVENGVLMKELLDYMRLPIHRRLADAMQALSSIAHREPAFLSNHNQVCMRMARANLMHYEVAGHRSTGWAQQKIKARIV